MDDNINDVLASQKKFDDKYNIEVIYDKFKPTANEVKFKITDKSSNAIIKDANLELLITRPDLSKFDIRPKFTGIKDGFYTFENFGVNKKGRWQILFKTTIGQLTSFVKLETYAVIQ